MNARDLSPADWAALKHLRQEIAVLVDGAGRHVESLQRLASGGLIQFIARPTAVPWEQVSEAQRALGYTMDSGIGVGGQRYAVVPSWMWPCLWCRYESPVRDLLRQHECRAPAHVDWDEFCAYVDRMLGRTPDCDRWPTVGESAERFAISVEQMTDVVDDWYWAFRNGCRLAPLAQQEIELEGE